MRLALALWLAAAPAMGQEITWPPAMYDPAAEADPAAPADLVLPMPCGGAMAFQRVDVPTAKGDPLDDARVRLGQSEAETGYSDYLHSEYLRGPFLDPDAAQSFYFIARYELTVGQYRALNGDCAAPGPPDRLAQGGLSWFEAVHLGEIYSEWLIANAPDSLPAAGDRKAFLRLPTEVEWEYAARGGSRIDPADFPARRFFRDGELADYALFDDGRRKSPGPVGIRLPNPLGLYDVYGNAEELIFEPFRLNVVGRPSGQAGGLITRGGAIDASEGQIYTAQRTEYPMFDAATGQAQAGAYFGARFVITANVVSEDNLQAIRTRWAALAEEGPVASGDAMTQLASILKSETDPRRQQALSGVQLQFRRAQEEAKQAQEEGGKSTLLSAGAFVEALRKGDIEVRRLKSTGNELGDRIGITAGDQRKALMQSLRITVAAIAQAQEVQKTYLLVLRTALENLTNDVPPEVRSTAYEDLTTRMRAGGQGVVADQVDAAWSVLATFAAKPDMDQAELLTAVLAP